MKKSRRIMNSLVLTLFLGSNFLTPISYAVGENEEVIEPSTEVTKNSETVDSNSDSEISEGGGSFNQNLSADQEEGVEDENTEGNEDIINLDNITDEDENNDNNIDENNEDENEVTGDLLPISGDESDNNIAKTGTNNTVLEHNNFFIGDEEGEKDSTSSLFSGEKSEVLEQSFTGENEELTGEVIKLNDKEIVGEKTYKNVTVKVVAPEKSFPEGTKLRINTIKQDKTIKEKENQLTEQIEEINEDTTMVSFDISFYNPENPDIELNPIEGKTVSVVFNYENNDELKEAAKDTNNSELKIYHLEEINDEGDVKPEELKTVNPEEVLEEEHLEEGESVVVSIEGTENLENLSNELEVQAESFSVYTIVVQRAEENPTQTWKYGKDYDIITILKPGSIKDEGLPEGITIMDRNLGATATGYAEGATNTSFGNYYQWGNNYGHPHNSSPTVQNTCLTWNSNYINSGYVSKSWINGSNCNYDVWGSNASDHYDGLWGGAGDSADNRWGAKLTNYDERQGPCPAGWHVPSAGEWGLLIKYWAETKDNGTNNNATVGGSNGLFYLNSNYGAFQQKFNLPFAGLRNSSSAALGNQGSLGYYWSSSPYGSDYPNFARSLLLNSSYVSADDDYYRAYGFSVRCFKDSYLAPKNYTLTFNSQGGSEVETGTTVENEKWERPSVNPTKENYTFVDWYTSTGYETVFDFSTIATANTTVYAKWHYNSCPENYDYDEDNNTCFIENTSTSFGTAKIYYGIDLDHTYSTSPHDGKKIGTITIVNPNDSTQSLTLMDMNLGATSLYVTGTSASNNDVIDGSFGELYQRGNNTPIKSASTGDYSTSQAVYENYRPGHPYNGSTFIQGSSDYWKALSTSINGSSNASSKSNFDVLWGGKGDDLAGNNWGGINNGDTRQGPCPEGYHVPSIQEWNSVLQWFATGVNQGVTNAGGASEGLYYFSNSTNRQKFQDAFLLPRAGYRDFSSAALDSQGSDGTFGRLLLTGLTTRTTPVASTGFRLLCARITTTTVLTGSLSVVSRIHLWLLTPIP